VNTGAVVRSLDTGTLQPGNYDVAVSGDGRLLVMTGTEPAAFIWDLQTGERISDRFVGHVGNVSDIAFTADGRAVVTGSQDGTVRIWDPRTGRQLRALAYAGPFVRVPWVTGLALAPDGKLIASCSLDDTVRLWDFASGKQIYQMCGHGTQGADGSTELAFADDGQSIYSFGIDLFLRVWDVGTGKALREYAIRPSGVKFRELENGEAELAEDSSPRGVGRFLSFRARFARDGKRLFLDLRDAIHVFDTQSGRETEVLRTVDRGVYSTISPDGKMMATITLTGPGIARLRDFASKKLIREFPLPGDHRYYGVFSPNDRFVVSGGSSQRPDGAPARSWLSVWDTASGQEYARIENLKDMPARQRSQPTGSASHQVFGIRPSSSGTWSDSAFRHQRRQSEEQVNGRSMALPRGMSIRAGARSTAGCVGNGALCEGVSCRPSGRGASIGATFCSLRVVLP